MKVYIVAEDICSCEMCGGGYSILAVFLTEEKAEQFVNGELSYNVHEMEVSE